MNIKHLVNNYINCQLNKRTDISPVYLTIQALKPINMSHYRMKKSRIANEKSNFEGTGPKHKTCFVYLNQNNTRC